MAGSANVRSTVAIETFRLALRKYVLRTTSTIDALDAKLRRASEWLDHDCPAYWKKQTKLAEDGLQEAKLGLEHCLMFPTAGERPTCREERAVLKRAQARLAVCHEKREYVRSWKGRLRHEVFEYKARIGQLKRLLEIDLAKAEATLQQLGRRLEEYQIERPPASLESMTQAPSNTSQADVE